MHQISLARSVHLVLLDASVSFVGITGLIKEKPVRPMVIVRHMVQVQVVKDASAVGVVMARCKEQSSVTMAI